MADPSGINPPGNTPTHEAPVPTAPATQRLVLTIAILASFVAFLDGTVVNVALPAILKEFGGGIATQQWTVDAYLITLGAFILVAGSASDVFGRIRVIRWGLIGFGVTSVAVALAPTASVLIGARLLQGVAGAMLVPSSLALIMQVYRGAAQARAIGTWTGATSAAMIVGPLMGGLFVDLATWRLAFLINVLPIAFTLWLLTRLTRPPHTAAEAASPLDHRQPNARIDLPGALLCVAGLGGIVYALIEQPTQGWGAAAVWLTGVGGVLAFAGFLWRQATAISPMLPLGLFSSRNFAWGNLATVFVYGALSLSGLAVVVFLQETARYTATAAALAMLPITFSMILLSRRMGALAGRLGPRLFMTVGPMLMAGGALLLLTVGPQLNYVTQVLPGVLLMGVGLAVTVSPLTAAILGAIEPARSGIASATNNAVSRVAGLIVIAMLGAITGGALDLDGFRRAMAFSAVLLALGGVVSWVGIRTQRTPVDAHE